MILFTNTLIIFVLFPCQIFCLKIFIVVIQVSQQHHRSESFIILLRVWFDANFAIFSPFFIHTQSALCRKRIKKHAFKFVHINLNLVNLSQFCGSDYDVISIKVYSLRHNLFIVSIHVNVYSELIKIVSSCI